MDGRFLGVQGNRAIGQSSLTVVRCTYENEKVDVDIPSQSGSNLLQSYSIDKCVLRSRMFTQFDFRKENIWNKGLV